MLLSFGFSALCSIFVFWSFDVLAWLTEFDEKRVVASGILVFSGLSIAVSPFLANSISSVLAKIPTSVKFALAAVGILAAITLWKNPFLELALREIAMYGLLTLLIFSVAAASCHYSEKLIIGLISVLTIGCLIYSFCALLAHTFNVLEGYLPIVPRRGYNFANVRFFNHLQAWTFPLLVFASLSWRVFPLIRISGASAATIWVALALYSKGAGITIALVAGGIVTIAFITSRQKASPLTTYIKRYVQIIGAGLALWVLAFLWYPQLMNASVESSANLTVTDFGLSGRDRLWVHAINWISETPWLGRGPINLVQFKTTPHNSLLQWSMEWGVISALLLTFILGYGWLKWVAYARTKTNATIKSSELNLFIVALTVSAISALVLSMVSGIIVTPFSQLLGAIVLGFMLGLYQRDTNKNLDRQNRQLLYGVRLFAIFCVAIYAKATIPEILDRYMTGNGYTTKYLYHHEKDNGLNPRFWQHGPFPTNRTGFPFCYQFGKYTLDWECLFDIEIEQSTQRESKANLDAQ